MGVEETGDVVAAELLRAWTAPLRRRGAEGDHAERSRYELAFLVQHHAHDVIGLVDVGVVCPSTRCLLQKGTDLTPALAAGVYSDIKAAKYSDQGNFIVEAGVSLHLQVQLAN